jgi:hypothetical protein
MKRSTARWTTAIAAAALFVAPAAGRAQTPQTPSPSTQETRPSSDQQHRQGTASTEHGSAHEHLQKAQAALNDIPAASLTGTAKTRIAELKRHVSKLEQSAGSAHSGHGTTGQAAKNTGRNNWSSDVAAADRILSELLGSGSSTGATEPTGTSGAATPKRSETAGAATLDETTRAKLQEVRTHITAFAASMSGTGSPAPSSDDPSSSAAASAQAPSPAPSPSSPAASASPSQAAEPRAPQGSAAGETANASPGASAPAQSAAASQQSTSDQAEPAEAGATPTGTSGTTQPGAPEQTPAAQADTEDVKRHLTAARESLSQLTQLPAAAQLTGDARTQVSQLISNFNELITTNVDWRASYAKVQANLQTLIGEQRTDESATPTAGTAGAVGTAGAASLDPAIRTKLIELRTHLSEFEKAAGGSSASTAGASPTSAAAGAQPSEPTASAAVAAAPTPSATTGSTATAAPESAAAAAPSATPGATGTTGSTASPSSPATAGTSGSTAAGADAAATTGAAAADADAQQPGAASSRTTRGADDAKAGHDEAMRHIAAIEAILNGRSTGATAGTSGTSGSTGDNRASSAAGGPATLGRAQIEEIKKHLAELKKGLNESADRR